MTAGTASTLAQLLVGRVLQLTTAALIGPCGGLLALLAIPAIALTVQLVPLTALAVLGALLAARTATAA